MKREDRRGIALCGNMLIDRINTVERYPAEGELLPIIATEAALGGAVPNVGIDIKRLAPDIPVYAYGIVGRDENGSILTDVMSAEGIITGGIKVTDTRPTTFTEVISVKGGQRTFFTYSGADALLRADDIDTRSVEAKLLYVGYFLLLDSIDRGEGLKLLRAAREMGIETCADMVSRRGADVSGITACLPFIDNLIINEIEAEMLLNSKGNIADMANALLSRGIGKRVIIHSSDISVCASGSGLTVMPSFDLPIGYVKGSTGAGDAFAAGALVAIHEGLSDKEILELASSAAAVSLASVSATGAMTVIPEIKKITESFDRKNICL